MLSKEMLALVASVGLLVVRARAQRVDRPQLAPLLAIKKGAIVGLVGGGGKTSLLFALARSIVKMDPTMRVVCTTTTKMHEPKIPGDCDCLVSVTRGKRIKVSVEDQLRGAFGKNVANTTPIVILIGGLLPDTGGQRKIKGVGQDLPSRLVANGACDIVLVEADGARKLPFKAPDKHEPALPLHATHVIAVAGVDCIGTKLTEEHVCRASTVSELTGTVLGEIVTPDCVATILASRSTWRVEESTTRFIACINKVDTREQLVSATQIAQLVHDRAEGVAVVLTGEVLGKRGVVMGSSIPLRL
jgi:probable selenium-dependent hydroxylase accessory protein YqeC